MSDYPVETWDQADKLDWESKDVVDITFPCRPDENPFLWEAFTEGKEIVLCFVLKKNQDTYYARVLDVGSRSFDGVLLVEEKDAGNEIKIMVAQNSHWKGTEMTTNISGSTAYKDLHDTIEPPMLAKVVG